MTTKFYSKSLHYFKNFKKCTKFKICRLAYLEIPGKHFHEYDFSETQVGTLLNTPGRSLSKIKSKTVNK